MIEIDGKNYCKVTVHIREEEARKYNLQPGMKVHGVSVIDNRTIWQLLFKTPVD